MLGGKILKSLGISDVQFAARMSRGGKLGVIEDKKTKKLISRIKSELNERLFDNLKSFFDLDSGLNVRRVFKVDSNKEECYQYACGDVAFILVMSEGGLIMLSNTSNSAIPNKIYHEIMESTFSVLNKSKKNGKINESILLLEGYKMVLSDSEDDYTIDVISRDIIELAKSQDIPEVQLKFLKEDEQ